MPVYIWFPVLTGLGVGYAFMSIPPVADQFMHLFGVGYGGLSLLLSGILWSHSLSQIPAGILVDRVGVYRCLIAGASAGVAANVLPFLAPENMALAIAMRFVLGLCTGVLFLSILKILALLTPPAHMPVAQGIYGGSFGFGTMFPYFTLPYTGEWGWGFSYVITGSLFMAMLAGVLLLPREGLRGQRPGAAGGGAGSGVTIAELLRRTLTAPDLWMLGLMHGVFYSTLTNLGQWLPSVLADLDGTTLSEWGVAATLALLLGSCSRTASGYFLQLLSRTTAVRLCLFATFALYVGLGAAGSAPVGLVLGLCIALACGLCYGVIFTMAGMVLPAAYMGTALGFVNSVANLCNVGLTLVYGYARDLTGSFSPALYLAAAATLAFVVIFSRRFARLDDRLQ